MTSSVFHDFGYLEKVQEALARPIKIFLSESRTGDSKMALAMFSRLDHKGLSLAPFTPYNPVWLVGNDEKNFSEGFRSICDEMAVFKGRHYCHLAPKRNLKVSPSTPWTKDEYFTYHIDLRGDDWAKNYSKSLSRILKKGRGKIEVEINNELSNLVCDLVAASYQRNGRNLPLNLDSMKVFAQSMIKLKLAKAYLAKDRATGEIKAGVICLGNSDVSHYWMAGGTRGAWMTILIDGILDSLAKESTSTFDFLGANHSSIAEFKRRFGGELVSYQGFQSKVGAEAKFRATISGIINK